MQRTFDLRPRGESRNFVHKRLFRAAKGFLTGGPTGAFTSFLAPSAPRGPTPLELARQQALSVPGLSAADITFIQSRNLAQLGQVRRGPAPCPPFFARIAGICVPVGPVAKPLIETIFPPQPEPEFNGFVGPDQFGQAVMGRFGPALQPASRSGVTLICPRGSVLGVDKLCYNRGEISNKQRLWPRGRRPLLTGGEMRAISTASSAAKKLQRTEKRLQEMGLLKKPVSRRAPAKPAALAVPRVVQIQQE